MELAFSTFLFEMDLSSFLSAAMKRGFELPLDFEVVGSNGTAAYGRYEQLPDEEGWDNDSGEIRYEIKYLSQHVVDGHIELPIKALVTSSWGQSGRMSINELQHVFFNW